MPPVLPTARAVAAHFFLLILAVRSTAFELQFDYRFDETGFFEDELRRSALESAAREFTANLQDGLAPMSGPGLIGVIPHPIRHTLMELQIAEVPADTLLIFVGANRISGQIAVGGPGHVRFPCFELYGRKACFAAWSGEGPIGRLRRWMFRNAFRSSPAARAYPPTDFAPWGGFLTFGSDVDWHFDPSVEVEEGRFDFFSAAVHEIGHVMGVGTAESWATYTRAQEFTGPRVSALGETVTLADDRSHWARGTTSERDGRRELAVFNETLARGERRRLTALDLAALRDLGWEPRDESDGATFETAYSSRWIKGDVDGNGAVDGEDASIVRSFLYDLQLPADLDLSRADVAPHLDFDPLGDGFVDALDREYIMRAANLNRLGDELQERMVSVDGRLALVTGADLYFFEPLASERVGYRLLRWWLPNEPENPTPGVLFRGSGSNAGDLDGDGEITFADVEIIDAYLASNALADPRAHAAADVYPAVSGSSEGDGRVDERDLELLERAASVRDVDGDGIATVDESAFNGFWMQLIGRPRFEPLTRWTEECLPSIDEGPFGLEIVSLGGISLEFCGRNGSAWSLRQGVSPEQYAEIVEIEKNDGGASGQVLREEPVDSDGEGKVGVEAPAAENADSPHARGRVPFFNRSTSPALQPPVGPAAPVSPNGDAEDIESRAGDVVVSVVDPSSAPSVDEIREAGASAPGMPRDAPVRVDEPGSAAASDSTSLEEKRDLPLGAVGGAAPRGPRVPWLPIVVLVVLPFAWLRRRAPTPGARNV